MTTQQDKVIYSKDYETAEEKLAKIVKAVISALSLSLFVWFILFFTFHLSLKIYLLCRSAHVHIQTIIIQTFFRRWHAKRLVSNLREAHSQYHKWQDDKARAAREEEEREYELDMFRRLNPRTAEDFDMLYSSLESKCFKRGFMPFLFFKCLFETERERAYMFYY